MSYFGSNHFFFEILKYFFCCIFIPDVVQLDDGQIIDHGSFHGPRRTILGDSRLATALCVPLVGGGIQFLMLQN